MASTQVTAPPSVFASTNLGPLSSSSSFPANCLEGLYDFNTWGLGLPYSYETQGCALSTCCPSDRFYTVGWGWFSSYYSPAVCPSQYQSCAPYTGLSTAPDETIIFCCPTNYACPSNSAGAIYWACASLLSTATKVTVVSGLFNQQIVSTRPFTLDSTLVASYQVAYPIQIRFKTAELTSSGTETWITSAAVVTSKPQTTHASMTTSTAPNPVSPSRLSTSPSSNAQHTSTASGGLTAGAKIGLGVGLGVGLSVLLVLLIYCLLSRRRRRGKGKLLGRAPASNAEGLPNYAKAEASELDGPKLKVNDLVHDDRQELEAPEQVAELPAR